MDEIERIRDEIVTLCKPEKIILFGTKHNVSTGSLREITLCVVVESPDKAAIERRLYMDISSELAFNVLLYTPVEWHRHLDDEQSYAHRIMEKGTVIYG